mgnify:CR=1 FL=1
MRRTIDSYFVRLPSKRPLCDKENEMCNLSHDDQCVQSTSESEFKQQRLEEEGKRGAEEPGKGGAVKRHSSEKQSSVAREEHIFDLNPKTLSSSTTWLRNRAGVSALLRHRLGDVKSEVNELEFVDGINSGSLSREVVKVAFDPVGELLAITSRGGTINVYEFDDCLRAEAKLMDALIDLSLSSESTEGAPTEFSPPSSASSSSGSCRQRVEAAVCFTVQREVSDLVWNPCNPDQLAVAYETSSVVDIFDLNDDDVYRRRRRQLIGHSGGPTDMGSTTICFVDRAHDLCVLAGTKSGQLCLWQVATAQVKKRIRGSNKTVKALWSVLANTGSRGGTGNVVNRSGVDAVQGLCALSHYEEKGTWFAAVTQRGVVALWNIDELRSRSFESSPKPMQGPRLNLWEHVLWREHSDRDSKVVEVSKECVGSNALLVSFNSGRVFHVNLPLRAAPLDEWRSSVSYHPRAIQQQAVQAPSAVPASQDRVNNGKGNDNRGGSLGPETLQKDMRIDLKRQDGGCRFAVIPWLSNNVLVTNSYANRPLLVPYDASPVKWGPSSGCEPCRTNKSYCVRGKVTVPKAVKNAVTGHRDMFTTCSLKEMMQGHKSVTLKVLHKGGGALDPPTVVHEQEVRVDCVTKEGFRLAEPYLGPPVTNGLPEVHVCLMHAPDGVKAVAHGPVSISQSAVEPEFSLSWDGKPCDGICHVTALGVHPHLPYVVAGYATGKAQLLSCFCARPELTANDSGADEGEGETTMAIKDDSGLSA